MKRKLSYAIVIALCGMMGFTSCTKDYDDDLRIHREMIENNEKELRATIDAYQVLVNNTIEQMEIAYKNADNLIKQEMKAEFDAAKARLTALETALNRQKQHLGPANRSNHIQSCGSARFPGGEQQDYGYQRTHRRCRIENHGTRWSSDLGRTGHH